MAISAQFCLIEYLRELPRLFNLLGRQFLDGLVASGKSETLRSDDIKSRKVFTKLSSRILVVCAFGLAGCATNSNVSTTRNNFRRGRKARAALRTGLVTESRVVRV